MKPHSKLKTRKIENEADLDAATLQWKRDYAVFLKAGDHSYRYMSDVLGVTTRMVRGWFEDEEMLQRVAQVQADMADGALKLLRRYSIEAVELLMRVARKAEKAGDWGDAIKAVEGVLDRTGLSKVNKSESKVTKTEKREVEGFESDFARFQQLSVEDQRQVADLMEEAQSILARSEEAKPE